APHQPAADPEQAGGEQQRPPAPRDPEKRQLQHDVGAVAQPLRPARRDGDEDLIEQEEGKRDEDAVPRGTAVLPVIRDHGYARSAYFRPRRFSRWSLTLRVMMPRCCSASIAAVRRLRSASMPRSRSSWIARASRWS